MNRVEQIDWRRALGADDAHIQDVPRSGRPSIAQPDSNSVSAGGNTFIIGGYPQPPVAAPAPAQNNEFIAVLLHMDRNAQADRTAQAMQHQETIQALSKGNRRGWLPAVAMVGLAALIAIKATGDSAPGTPATVPAGTQAAGVMPAAIGTECFPVDSSNAESNQVCLSNPVSVTLAPEAGPSVTGLAVHAQIMQPGGAVLESSEEARAAFEASFAEHTDVAFRVGDYLCRAAAGQSGVPVALLFGDEQVESVENPMTVKTEGC